MNTFQEKSNQFKSQSASSADKASNAKSTFTDNRAEASQAAQLKAMAEENAVQRVENNTGLPDNLKSGMENLSGMNLDSVKVHYNSSKPAAVQAHAYAQGTDIHLAQGQEKHLPHELGHVVQQAQGRVQPTTSVNGLPVNDDANLEKEADSLGAKALKGGQA